MRPHRPGNIANMILAKLVQSRSENRHCLQRMRDRQIVWQQVTTAKTKTQCGTERFYCMKLKVLFQVEHKNMEKNKTSIHHVTPVSSRQ